MATAKLWLQGSTWKTTDTLFAWDSTGSSSSYAQASISVRVIAYDDFTIKIVYSVSAWANMGVYQFLNTDSLSVSSGGTTLYSGKASSNPKVDVTNKLTASWSWALQPVSSSGYGPAGSGSKTATYDTPFYTVTYNANGGSDAPTATRGVKNYTSSLSADSPTRTNHTFLGWATSSSAHTADYSPSDTLPAQSADITLYAVWQPCVFITADEGVTITFDGVAYTNTTATVGKTWGNEYALTITANTGFIIKTQSHADGNVEIDADEITISATSQRVGCHIDDGNDFVQAVMYVDNGVSWDMVQAYVDNGVSWELVY